MNMNDIISIYNINNYKTHILLAPNAEVALKSQILTYHGHIAIFQVFLGIKISGNT